ncbi:hypothetical protein CK203_105440 [Vitis vinifera]|uniref:Uncharacterized protein n=1 Tax=Vitis vinifera TaxID=29760 RepID=A0A438F7V1_VITVI|nr:hypothetical protein CK203_105440 [Vitis vinifera]
MESFRKFELGYILGWAFSSVNLNPPLECYYNNALNATASAPSWSRLSEIVGTSTKGKPTDFFRPLQYFLPLFSESREDPNLCLGSLYKKYVKDCWWIRTYTSKAAIFTGITCAGHIHSKVHSIDSFRLPQGKLDPVGIIFTLPANDTSRLQERREAGQATVQFSFNFGFRNINLARSLGYDMKPIVSEAGAYGEESKAYQPNGLTCEMSIRLVFYVAAKLLLTLIKIPAEYGKILNLLAIQKGKMAHHHDQSILLPLLLITLSLMSCKEVFASRHLLEETTLPKVPELPKPELPPLPTLPTFPIPELPPLPHIPTLPESTLPTLPKPELPTVPHVPALEKPELSPLPKLEVPKLPEVPPLPHLPDLPKPTLPTVPTLPKDIPFPSLSPPHSTTSP